MQAKAKKTLQSKSVNYRLCQTATVKLSKPKSVTKVERAKRHLITPDILNAVKPPNKGHIGDGSFVLCREVFLFLEVLF